MTYTVVWIRSALDELADLWTKAGDRQEITDASGRIDLVLRTNPYLHSESRGKSFRILFVPPLAVLFEVSDADRMVTVRAVWRPA
jgi:hypothetical protein